jgi:hypothetical protein
MLRTLTIVTLIALILILLAVYFSPISAADEVVMSASVPTNDYRECVDVCKLLYQ